MTTLMQDVRYALRQLRKTPGFTATVLLTLALGIGANAAIFTLVNAVLLKRLPVGDPKSLVRIGDTDDCCVSSGTNNDTGDYSMFSLDTYQQLRKNSPEFEDLAAIRRRGLRFGRSSHGAMEADTQAKSVMGSLFQAIIFGRLVWHPQAGRLFTDGDDVQGVPITAVMSFETWQHDYAGDPAVVGSTFWINTKAVTVVGIAPEGFFGDRVTSTPPDYYLPIEAMETLANAPYVHTPRARWLYIVGRVKPGVALGSLQSKLSALTKQAISTQSDFTGDRGRLLLQKTHVVLTPGGAGIQSLQDEYAAHLHLLMWVSSLVLLIACANIANLLLVRGMARKAEMSVRTALGAMRGRIVRQLLTESLVLSSLGAVAGLGVAYAGTQMLLKLAFPGAQNVPIQASPSLAVMGHLQVWAGDGDGHATVWRRGARAWIAAQARPADALRSGSRTTSTGATLLQRGLVVLQAGLSLVLLVGAGLFAQSLGKLERTDMKLNATNRYIVHINPQAAGYPQTQLEALYKTMEERFHTVPGVVKVGISSYTPMEDNNNGWGVQVQGQPTVTIGASIIRANAEYFDSVGTRVVMGRGITEQDTSTAPRVALVNEAFVKRMFKPGENPIGHRIGSPDSPGDFEIVGVVENTSSALRCKGENHTMSFLPAMQRGGGCVK